jgi:hypothetical protein
MPEPMEVIHVTFSDPHRTIIVEPVELPAEPAPAETPAREPKPEPEPERAPAEPAEPQKVPAGFDWSRT